jgi:hypothetical protein
MDDIFNIDSLKNIGRNQYGTFYSQIKRGMIISFLYSPITSRPIHDPNPIIIVTETDTTGKFIRGVNLHYIPTEISQLISTKGLNACSNPSFNYGAIKNRPAIYKAYREYKRAAMLRVKILDCNLLKMKLKLTMELLPQELKAMEDQVDAQLNKVNPSIEDLKKSENQQNPAQGA